MPRPNAATRKSDWTAARPRLAHSALPVPRTAAIDASCSDSESACSHAPPMSSGRSPIGPRHAGTSRHLVWDLAPRFQRTGADRYGPARSAKRARDAGRPPAAAPARAETARRDRRPERRAPPLQAAPSETWIARSTAPRSPSPLVRAASLDSSSSRAVSPGPAARLRPRRRGRTRSAHGPPAELRNRTVPPPAPPHGGRGRGSSDRRPGGPCHHGSW